MSETPTIYESRARRRRRRKRGALLGALLALVVVAAAAGGAAVLLRADEQGAGASQAAPPASPSPSASPARVAGLVDLEVHRGDKATVRYRVVGAAGAPVTVTLVVTDAAGAQVKARRVTDRTSTGGRLQATVPVDLPAGTYTYALRLGEDGSSASPSPSSGDAASAELRVLPPLPPGFPGAKAVARAKQWLGGRDGEAAFAVVDTNGEGAGGLNEHRTFQAASLVKAILLVAALRDDPTPDAATEATLTKMITQSDNGAAYAVFGRVGGKGMRAVARAAGMRDYEQGAGWVDTRVSAADQARFFYDLESLVPAAGRSLARRLLSGITPMQRWGIPAAAGPEGWKTYFKGGWLGLDNKLMIQAAWLEKGEKKWALAVMTDENPSRSYGWDTEKGVTGLLLGQEPTPAYFAVVLE